MKRRYGMVRALTGVLAATVVVGLTGPAVAAPQPAPAATQAKPITIPALRSWTAAPGELALDKKTKIVVSRQDAKQLEPVARMLGEDITARTGLRVDVVTNSGQGGKGDVVLQLAKGDSQLGQEGYQLDVGRTATIKAGNSRGVFYGTQTLLQLLGDDTRMPAGQTKDWPTYEERGLMVDIARMHFSEDWLKARIRDMAYLKLNTLHLHLTDDDGWRVESNFGLQSSQYLTKKQVKDLVAYAGKRQITVVPEVDMPAHLGKLLEKYPQYRLKAADGTISPTKIDFTNPEARKLLKDVVAEYMPLFPGQYWHIGTDEYLSNSQFAQHPQLQRWAQSKAGANATGKDALILFANEMNAFVRSHGKTTRVWNDNVGGGTTVNLDSNVVVQFWTDSDSEDFFGPNAPFTPQQLLDKGHQVVNDSFLYTYTAPPGGQSVLPGVDYQYDKGSPERFYGYLFRVGATQEEYFKPLPDKLVAPSAPGLRGGNLNMWNSGGTWTPEEGAANIYPRLRVMAQKTWDSPQLVPTYAEFSKIIDQVGSPN